MSEDIAVPFEALEEAIVETLAIGERHGLETCSWGHAGDANLHSPFLLDPGDEEQVSRAEAAAQDLFSRALRLGGTVSGEPAWAGSSAASSTVSGAPRRSRSTARSSARATRRA